MLGLLFNYIPAGILRRLWTTSVQLPGIPTTQELQPATPARVGEGATSTESATLRQAALLITKFKRGIGYKARG